MRLKTILLIEDNPDDIELVEIALSTKRIANEITVVTDGAEALDFLFCQGKYTTRNTQSLPTLILLDLQLPKIDGLEVLKQIRKNEKTKLIPVIIFTSSNEERDIIESYQLGANSYVRKPVDADQFEKAVQELEMYWLLINKPPPNN